MNIKHALVGLAAAFSFAAPAFATPVEFNIDLITLTPGIGYGINSDSLLDVTFSAPSAPGSFMLDTAGIAFKTFTVSSVNLLETCINPSNCPGTGNETKDLNLAVKFHFISPFTGNQEVTMLGTAKPGGVSDDAQEDYALDFTAQTFTFGSNSFQIDLSDLSFTTNGAKNLTATITLLQSVPATNVPEPTSLALLGIGMAGLAFRSRRKA